MGSLFKAFGRGVLYVIGFPFFVVALLLFGIIGIFLFLYQLIRSIICLFTGKKFFPELPEDKELRLKREQAFASNNPEPQPAPEPRPQGSSAPSSVVLPMMEDEPQVFQEEPMYQSNNTVENACFGQQQKYDLEPEPVKEDPLERMIEDEPEEVLNEEPMKEETIISSSEETPEVEEELEEYIPGGSSFQDIADEEDTSNGVDIKYDL